MKSLLILLSVQCIFALDVAVLRSSRSQNASETQFSPDEMKAVSFLQRYGYLPRPPSRVPLTRALFVKALNNYQVMANLPIRNRLEHDILSSMNAVRCGNADVRRNEQTGVARFEILAPRWRKSNLTWRVSRYPIGQPNLNRPIVDNALRKATRMWSNSSRIDFIQLSEADTRSADIDIKFERSGYDATCDVYFSVGELAHATLTRHPAKVHFNGRVMWKVGLTQGSSSDVDLVAVAAHEIGHVLGLDHSADRGALMYASYRRQNLGLGRDDIQAVQYLYGARRPENPEQKPEPEPKPEPEQASCPKSVTLKMPDGKRPLCAAVYSERVCQGERLAIESGNKTRRLSAKWDNEISSAEVNPQCTLILCHRALFGGGCIDLRGENEGHNYNRLPLGYDNLITSLACVCDNRNAGPTEPEESAEDTDQRDVGVGREPPAFIPNTNARTCAVLMTDVKSDATKAWVEEEILMTMPDSLEDVTYVYLATRRGCTLFYCSEPAFGGLCEELSPSSHVFSAERVSVGSLSCLCN